MDWTRQFDGYCERTDLTYWAEPVNAITNLAFIIAALVMFTRSRQDFGATVLCVILFAIGVGSYLFHTHATVWAVTADVVPIGLFILTYLYLVNFRLLGWPLWLAALGTALFVPYAAIVTPLVSRIPLNISGEPFFAISNFYWTVPILLVAYASVLRKSRPTLSRGFLVGAALLAISITLRSLDEIICTTVPLGSHFLWHCLNALMLGYMIHVYLIHVLAVDNEPR